MSSIFNPSAALCALKRENTGKHLCVGLLLVLSSVAVSGETLEIAAGLIGALVICLMREHSSKRRACGDKLGTHSPCKSQAAGRDSASAAKKSKCVQPPERKSSSELIQNIKPRLHQAEPRVQLSLADSLPLCEQADQLLGDILPGKADESVCAELTRLVTPCVKKLIPEAQIDIVAHSSVVRIGRTGLRPEVDLVITVPPKTLAQRLLIHMQAHAGDQSVRKLDKIMEVDENTLNKFAIRAVSTQLSFCKLWRTAYRGMEPKVVLLAPRCLGVLSEDMHVHVYVNCPNTVRSKDLFNQSDNHIQKFIAFVRRWAQDRCIANTTYGHMPLYAWTILARDFCLSHEDHYSKTSIIDLFGVFVDFNMKRHESLSQAQFETAIEIADPDDAKRNVAACMSPMGMKRFREELERAKTLLANKSSLLTILEHCNPSTINGTDVLESSM